MSKKIKLASCIALVCVMFVSMATVFSSAVFYYGDADNNGKVTSGDARIILRMALSLDPKPAQTDIKFILADVDGNGKITSSDARSALRMALNLDAKKEYVTNPPATNPPVTNPPVTNPPVTNPPVTNPPVTNPPVTNPPVTNPPVTDAGIQFGPGSNPGSVDIGNL